MKANKLLLLCVAIPLVACNSGSGIVEPLVEWQASNKDDFSNRFDSEEETFFEAAKTFNKSFDFTYTSEDKIDDKTTAKSSVTIKYDINASKCSVHAAFREEGTISEDGTNQDYTSSVDTYFGYYDGVGCLQATIDNISGRKFYNVLASDNEITHYAEENNISFKEACQEILPVGLERMSAYYLVDGNCYDYRRYDDQSYWEYQPDTGSFDLTFKTGDLGDYFFTGVVSGIVGFGFITATETTTVTADVRDYSLWSLVVETQRNGQYDNHEGETGVYTYVDKAETKPVKTRKFKLPSLNGFVEEK